MAKVFVRTNDLDNERPIIVAKYRDDTVIADDAHGDGVTVLTVPDQVLGGPSKESLGLPSFVAGWRGLVGDIPVKAEAKRRIERSFSISDQLNALNDMVDAILKHGVDMARWPADVRQRKMAYDEGHKYIADVMDKVRANATMPRDPSSDKVWPRRLTKKI